MNKVYVYICFTCYTCGRFTPRFEVYNIDEFRTSCLNYKTEEMCNNLYLPDKRNIERKMHATLTFTPFLIYTLEEKT